MSVARRCELMEHWRALKGEHDAESDAIDMLRNIERETQEAKQARIKRRHMLTVALVRVEAALGVHRIKPRDTRFGNATPNLEPAIPAVNRGVG